MAKGYNLDGLARTARRHNRQAEIMGKPISMSDSAAHVASLAQASSNRRRDGAPRFQAQRQTLADVIRDRHPELQAALDDAQAKVKKRR